MGEVVGGSGTFGESSCFWEAVAACRADARASGLGSVGWVVLAVRALRGTDHIECANVKASWDVVSSGVAEVSGTAVSSGSK